MNKYLHDTIRQDYGTPLCIGDCSRNMWCDVLLRVGVHAESKTMTSNILSIYIFNKYW